ncbi:uncharacterized protein Z520_03367 [Fonsecaea multimorphosa CBS 102226]|uniref:Uncharacterized protein n=1 Tax=Fonsecaea multimorphosa CBS 102226 TaxID=1442371 RepID=A0A0D2IUH1_9EURO|nr:uncharacterized protein Z520_03367 [Fonsecaea multimorphosa CBS 102226]KIY00702.1 hypothetical protein Z520_03367 [Fonsecaea multimorphosa CBS 102226]OAL27748.1 hypothetical protein AYO22_03290 [Fonsecaea multimorphosa]
MDPLCSTLSVVAGVASIVSVIGKSVATLNQLRQRYRDAELNINLLTGHLRTVRTALLQVQHWAECLSGDSQHYQLMMDLGDAITHCKLLVEYIDNQISKFQGNDEEFLRVGSKVLYLLEDQATKDCLTRLDHQINALNLCLTAFQCRTPIDQKRLLERDESREVFSQAKDDATSLVGFRDSASFVTARTGLSTATKWSKTFDFDGLLLRHKIYQNTFRSMLRRANSPTEERTGEKGQRRALSDTPLIQLKSTARDSAKIDLKLKQDARRLSKEVKILAVGDKHGRSAIVKQMRQRYGRPYSDSEVEQYRQSITSLAIKALVAILDYVKDIGNGLVSQISRDHADIIREFAESGTPDWKVPVGLAGSVKHIWNNWHVQQAFSVMQQHGQTAYYLNTIERICQADYTPSHMDIIRAPEAIDTMKETELIMNSSTLRIIEINEQYAVKIISQFADVQFCLFAIDLTCYDRYRDDAERSNELLERLSDLKSIVRSVHFTKSIILLILTNAAAFRKRIAISPMKSHFEDYNGGNDVNAATKYILKRCKQVNRLDLPLFWHIYDCAVDEGEAEAMDHFFMQSAASVPAVSWLRDMGVGAPHS